MSFARCVQVPMMRNLVYLGFIYCFSSKGRHLELDHPWSGLGSDKYIAWSNKRRFVCRLHKGDDPGFVSLDNIT